MASARRSGRTGPHWASQAGGVGSRSSCGCGDPILAGRPMVQPAAPAGTTSRARARRPATGARPMIARMSPGARPALPRRRPGRAAPGVAAAVGGLAGALAVRGLARLRGRDLPRRPLRRRRSASCCRSSCWRTSRRSSPVRSAWPGSCAGAGRRRPSVIDVTPKPAPGLPRRPGDDDRVDDERRDEAERRLPLTGLVALHGGGEYVAGDEPAMDALVAAGAAARPRPATRVRSGWCCVPTAAARHRPDLAAAHGRRAFEAAAARAGLAVEVGVAGVLDGRRRRGPRERGPPRDRPPDPSPGRRPGPAARGAARDARLGRHPPGARRRRVRRGCERRGDGARRAALDPRRADRRAGPGAGIAVLPHFDPRRAAAGGASWIPTAAWPGSGSTSGRSSSAARAGRGGSRARARPRDPAGRGHAG